MARGKERHLAGLLSRIIPMETKCPCPLVSVIVPAFNAEPFIHETLLSLMTQSHTNLEILVVDDGSKDRTATIVEEHAARDARIKLIQQPNQGVVFARNTGLSRARGDYVSLIDADDIWYPEKVEKQVRRFGEVGSDVGLVYTWSTALSQEGKLIGASNAGTQEGDVLGAMIYRNFIGNGSVAMVSRDCLNHVGGFDRNMGKSEQGCEDWDWLLRIAERYKYAVVPEFLVGYRQVNGSVSSDTERMWRSLNIVLNRMRAEHPELPRCLFNWSVGQFCLWQLFKAYIGGDLTGTLRNTYRALRADAAVLTVPIVHLFCIKSIIRLAAQPLTSLIWPDRRSWLEWKQKAKLEKTIGPTPTLQDVIEEQKKVPRNKDFYAKLLRRREQFVNTLGARRVRTGMSC
jgi:glycosyltransferase involved in cell wall biosynthesis